MDTKTAVMPSEPGEWTPAEAAAWFAANTMTNNLAGDRDLGEDVLRFVQGVYSDWTDRMRNLMKRWKITYHMLAGNTLETGGPADLHMPEIYKALETMVPRLEEVVLDQDPWFDVVPRRRKDRAAAQANAAYLDWQFEQANVRSLIQPAIRDMLVTQIAAFYVQWENRVTWRNVREVTTSYDSDGRLKKKVKIKRKKVVSYCGPSAKLVDPLDFIIDTKATSVQDAMYIGHRFWMAADELKEVGERCGWVNLDKIGEKSGTVSPFGHESEYWRYPRDPASLYGNSLDRTGVHNGDERPEVMEVIVLYSKWCPRKKDGDGLDAKYDDYQMIIVNGRTCVDLRKNPNDGGMRPYAVMRDTKSGHEFFSIGTFDNAVRINQHIDRLHQATMRTAEVAGMPLVFAEEDCDLPDSLYRARPLSVYRGTGPIRFTQVPDGALRSTPMIIGMLKSDLEETVGNFRINMGQDSNGTATEASLSLQEGNRRNRAHVRAIADGLDQLLTIFHKYNLQYSTEDVEFPVLGKRAIALKKDYLNFGPADLLDDVKFVLVGLRSSRSYGMRQTGLLSILNAGMPLVAANPQAVDQLYLLHSLVSEWLGPDEADRIVTLPTPQDMLRSQYDENRGLLAGEVIEVDRDDDHLDHMRIMVKSGIVDAAGDPDSGMPISVREAVLSHMHMHQSHQLQKDAARKAMEQRMPTRDVPPEAGGQNPNEPPPPGGMSNAMAGLGVEDGGPVDGQRPGQNPGPADPAKYGSGARRGRTINQTDDWSMA